MTRWDYDSSAGLNRGVRPHVDRLDPAPHVIPVREGAFVLAVGGRHVWQQDRRQKPSITSVGGC